MLKALLEKYFDETLSEEARLEIETMFETTVKQAADKRVADHEAMLEERYTAELKEFKSDLVDKLSEYLESTFTEWFNANKPAEVSSIKVAMAESVMGKLRGVLSDVFVEIKEEDVDVVKDLEGKLTEAKNDADKAGNEVFEAKRQSFEYQKAIAFMKMTEGLCMTDRESLLDLVEDIEAADIETFVRKANILKAKFIGTQTASTQLPENTVPAENPDENLNESADGEGEVDKYLPRGFN